jgi:catechol 2,3-dioxygenase-like lactoylglutathione lyase family enzyme
MFYLAESAFLQSHSPVDASNPAAADKARELGHNCASIRDGPMSTRINHVAITSDYYAVNARFYESLFAMRPAKKTLPPSRAISLGDGYVGMTHIPRRDGRTAGLDHFGLEVDDIEDTIARMQKFDPELSALKRPPIRPYAAFSAHDPDTNIFDLSQRNIGFQKDVYAENNGQEARARSIDHIALRTRHAERCAHFYAEVFGLALLNRPADGNFYLSDGRVTLGIIQWKLSDYEGMDPARLGLDHIGFKVEGVDAVKHDLDFLIGENPHLRGRALGYGSEGEARLKLFRQCPFGEHHFTDIEGVYLDVSAREAN